MAASWINDEPGFFALRHELRRLRDRARRRPRRVLAGALAVTAVGLVLAIRAPRDTAAQITIRVTEVVDFHLPRSAWTDRELRSFVTQVAFTNEVLGHIYQTHLADFAPAPNLGMGIERLREDIEVYAVRNRIMVESESQAQSGPRSAHVILRYAGPREDRALAVLNALSQPIMDSSSKRRRLETEQELARVRLQLEDAKKLVATLRTQALARASLPMAGAGSTSPVRMVELDSALKEAHLRVTRFQQDYDDAQLRQRAETRRSGIDFAIAEQSVERPLPLLPVLLTVALVTFLFGLPLAIVVVGAFASTVDTVEDIRRLGLTVLGRLPALDIASQPRAPGQARPGK